jgi:Na+-driven multidrug efflux pump
MMGIAGLGLFVFSESVIGLFTPDPQVIALGRIGLRIMAFAQPFSGLSIVITGILRAGGDTKSPFLVMLSGMWLVRMSVLVLCSNFLRLGIYGAWIAMIADLGYRGIIGYRIYRKGKWLHSWKN